MAHIRNSSSRVTQSCIQDNDFSQFASLFRTCCNFLTRCPYTPLPFTQPSRPSMPPRPYCEMRNFNGRRQGLMRKANVLSRKHSAKVAIFVQYNGVQYCYKSDKAWPAVPDLNVYPENSFSPDNFETVADRFTPLAASDPPPIAPHVQNLDSAFTRMQPPPFLSAADELQAAIMSEAGTDGETSCSSSSTYASFTSGGSPHGRSSIPSQASSCGSEELLEPPSSRTSSTARSPAKRPGRGIPPRKNTRSQSRGKQYFVE